MGVTLYYGYKGSGSKAEFVASPNKCFLFFKGLVFCKKEFGKAPEGHWFSCIVSIGLSLCSPIWFCSPKYVDTFLSTNTNLCSPKSPFFSKNLRLAQSLVFSSRVSWIIHMRVWEQMQFGKWPFCLPHKNLMFTMWRVKDSGILGIPRMQLPSITKLSFQGCASWSLQILLHSNDLQAQRWNKRKPQSWSPQAV